MRTRKKVVLAVLAVAAIGVGVYASRSIQQPVLEPTKSRTETKESIGQDEVAKEERDTVTERVKLATSLSDNVFSDIEDAQLDNQVIDNFLSARSIGEYRIVNVDADYLRTIIRESPENNGFSVQLMDDTPLRLLAKGVHESSAGWNTGIGTWIGAVDGDETSRASFVVAPDGSINGVVRTVETGRIKIEPIKGSPHHLIWTLAPDFSKNID